MFKCVCNKEFENNKKLGSHKSCCKEYKEYKKNISESELGECIEIEYLNGESVPQLSEKYNFDFQFIRNILVLRNVEMRNLQTACSNPKRSEKYKNTLSDRYGEGIVNVSQIDEIKQKKANKCLEKYGVDNYRKSEEFKERYKEINLEKYGVDNYSKTDECKEKIKETCLEKYGVDNYRKSDECKEKIKETCLEKYGVDSYSKTDECKEKIKETCLEKYGVEYVSQAESVKLKIRNSHNERYGAFPKPQPTRLTKPHKVVIEILNGLGLNIAIEKQILNYTVDCFLEKYNLIIEIFGKYWHADPRLYKSTDILRGQLVQEKWDYDKHRIERLKHAGYEVLIIWELDIESAKQIIEDCLENKTNYKIEPNI